MKTAICPTIAVAFLLAACDSSAQDGPIVDRADPQDVPVTIHYLETFEYYYAPTAFGPGTSLSLSRDGHVYYYFSSQPYTNSGGEVVTEKWIIKEEDAKAILDGLLKDGLLDLKTDNERKSPSHRIGVSAGRWQAVIQPAKLPGPILERLLPLLRKADPKRWNLDSQ